MSFAEGFASGFEMVDRALYRQNLLRLEDEAQKRAEQHYRDEQAWRQKEWDRQTQADQKNEEWKQKAWDKDESRYKDEQDWKGKEFDLKESQLKSENAYRQGQLGVSWFNAKSNAARDAAAIRASNIAAQGAQWELEMKKREVARIDAANRLQSYLAVDPATKTASINVPKGAEKDFIRDMRTGLGVDPYVVFGMTQEYGTAINVLKNVAMNPALFQKDQKPLISALNGVAAMEINKGVGYTDQLGNVIHGKKVTGVYYHPDPQEPNNPDKGFYTLQLAVMGKTKDGKPHEKDGLPMTQGRSSDPADKNVVTIGKEQFVQWVNGHDAALNIALSNPDFSKRIADSIKGLKGKEGSEDKNIKDNYIDVGSTDDMGVRTTVKVDPRTGETFYFDPESKSVRKGQVGEQGSASNEAQGVDANHTNAVLQSLQAKKQPVQPEPQQQAGLGAALANVNAKPTMNPQAQQGLGVGMVQQGNLNQSQQKPSYLSSNNPSEVLDSLRYANKMSNEDERSLQVAAKQGQQALNARILAIRDRVAKLGY